jgi:hypothetical protein
MSSARRRRRTNLITFDADAADFIRRVEQADESSLEVDVKIAYNDFIVGAKRLGVWPSIRTACFLCAARTLAGALTPLVGPAPTNNGFISTDYDRKIGLKGNRFLNKTLNANRQNTEDPQDSRHMAVWATELEVNRINPALIGSGGTNRTFIAKLNNQNPRGILSAASNIAATTTSLASSPREGFYGISRNSAAGYVLRFNQTNTFIAQPSLAPSVSPILVFARTGGSPDNESAHRLSFYSLGENLNLDALDFLLLRFMQALSLAIA